ncbi:MAG TPA: tRNA threonylcarbamoyladenosine dehydratase [Bdellovibrionota bacterium]|nr:tRNA threonylcarbamoyladenosine dehydratase [Bdellovibrionota bacterium]
MTENELENYRLHRRFDRMGRLVGDARMKKLMDSHVMIIGLGGVGSFAAESIMRSGVGRVTLVDFDDVCVTNFNRQLHALQGRVGQPKADVMAERMKQINPSAQVRSLAKFYNADHCAEIFSERPDFVIDAIDNVTAKCHLLAYCRTEKIPVVAATGSGGRIDPTAIRIADLGKTTVDPLAREIRRILREKHGFPSEEGAMFGIPAVYSTEPWRQPEELQYDGGKGFRCVCPQGDNPYFQCDNRNLILGNASFVTGSFGLFCASVAVRTLVGEPLDA